MRGCVDFHERVLIDVNFFPFYYDPLHFFNFPICFSYKYFIADYITTTTKIYYVMSTFKLRNCVESFVPSYVMHVFTFDRMVLFSQALTLRPIASNVKTATYNTGQYLANLLALLGKSDYTIINTTDFIHRLKKERIPRKYKMKLLDIQS